MEEKDKILYEKCKKIVKQWEFDFTAKKGRIPSKLDIKEANKNIRDAYRTYFRLKTQVLMSVIDFDDNPIADEKYEKSNMCTPNESVNFDSLLNSKEGEDSFKEGDTNTKNFEGPIDQNSTNIQNISVESGVVINELHNEAQIPDKETNLDQNVWGKHLNKAPESIQKEDGTAKGAKGPKISSNFSKKLFNNSMFSKRNPRTRSSLNLSRTNSFSKLDNSISETLSQPLAAHLNKPLGSLENLNDIYTNLNCSMPNIITEPKMSLSQPILLTESFLKNPQNFELPNRNLDKGWAQRATGLLNFENQNLTYDDADIISASEDEEESYRFSKRPKLSSKSLKSGINTKSVNSSGVCRESSTLESNFEKSKNYGESISISQNSISTLQIRELGSVDSTLGSFESQKGFVSSLSSQNEALDSQKGILCFQNSALGSSIVQNNTSGLPSTQIKNLGNQNHTAESSGTQNEDLDLHNSSLRQTQKVARGHPKARKMIQKIVSDSEGSHESDHSEDIDYIPDGGKKIKQNGRQKQDGTMDNSKKRKRQTKAPSRLTRNSNKKSEDHSEIPPENEEYVLEYSIKPPPKTVPRIRKLPTKKLKKSLDLDEESLDYDNIGIKKSQKEVKLEQKIKSGTLNDNFIRLDMKKKIFVKGKKNLNFTRYKKSLWKSKKKALYGPDMDMSGCDGGELVCFKCGNTGHFARNCKKPADQLLPLEGYQEKEPSPIPSLEEAQKMAQSSNLAIYKPKLATKDEPKESDDEIEDSKISDSDNDNEKHNGFTVDQDLEKFMSEFDFDTIEEPETPRVDLVDPSSGENFVQSVYKLNIDGSLPDTPKEVYKTLEEFGHKNFRSGQEKAVMRILCGQSTLVTLSTGSGKSLCYQLPALIYSRKFNCISLVVSPLVSLMDDQVSSADQFLGAACLHAAQTKPQREKVLKMLQQGLVKILLLSPEAVTMGEKSNGFGSILRKLPPIAFACIDEAHCVSQWSHNFRPSYLMICHVLREKLGIKTILGLTATATKATCNSIVHHLQISDGDEGIICDKPVPENLNLNISCDPNRDGALRCLLESESYKNFDSIIIYCTRREECERIASYLRTSLRPTGAQRSTQKFKSLNLTAEAYHAGMVASKRRTVQKAFMGGWLRIVVATVAFGMGINKQNIRAVIHYNMPGSFESYVQEVGRAGRDGLEAKCHVFLSQEKFDVFELQRHIYANSLDRFSLRKLLQRVFVKCSCKKICPKHEVAFPIESTVQDLDLPEENISTLLCYLELDFSQNIEILTPAYTQAKLIAYGPFSKIVKAAKSCPPLAMALALHPPEKRTAQFFEFPVIDVASAMGWDSGYVKKRLKQLEWITENGQQKRSKISVQFSNLGFRLRAPGNLGPQQLDETLDKLHDKVVNQLDTRLKQLYALHEALVGVASPNFRLCSETSSVELRNKIRKYFSSENPLENVENKNYNKDYSIEQIGSDVRQLVAMYRDNKFTARQIAKIFHGIQSPKYPAVIWGKCKFWRQHLKVDFETLLKTATQEIQKIH